MTLFKPELHAVPRVALRPIAASLRLVFLSLAAPCAALALAVDPQPPETDATPPSAIEQALMDHTCRPARLGTVDTEAYEACLRGRLQSLRNDFGVNLKRLTAPERKSLDALCSKFRLDREREDYVQCIGDQLVVLRERWNKGKVPAPAATADAAPAATDSAVPAPQSADDLSVSITRQPQSSSWSLVFWIGGAVALVAAAGAGAAVAVKMRRPAPRICRVCGAVSESGDMCSNCRHEAAEALRRSAVERAEEQRALEEEQRRLRELEEEQHRQRALQEEDMRRREEARVRAEMLARQEEERREREEEARRQRQTAASFEEFDPHVVLGLSPDASPEAVLAAYQEAKTKYHPDLVADFGPELQKHFKEKNEAVERAYQLLTK